MPTVGDRTNLISESARVIRRIVMKSSDPEALLFDDLPNALGDKLAPEPVFEALLECEAAYPALLLEMRRALGRALGVDPVTFEGIAERGAVTKNLDRKSTRLNSSH